MKWSSFRELDCWKESRNLVKEVYRLAYLLPQSELYALSDQLRRAVISVPSNIAEGHGRRSDKEFIRFLLYANGSLNEVESQLINGYDLGFFKEDNLTPIMQLKKRISKMIMALISSLEEQQSNPSDKKR